MQGHSNNDDQTKDPSLTDDVANNDGHQTPDVDWRHSTTFIVSPTWTSSKSTTVEGVDSLHQEDIKGGYAEEVAPVLAIGAGPYGGVVVEDMLL
ncbi:hypothetical protein JHK82_057449 [Glycine max]|nr:hypothetical protein JHK86_042474 [Glycine max]KAG5070691.1 hypothetical protein JHK82_057449 [Glycine max]